MIDRVPVYAYLLGALGSLVIGLSLLYAGASRIGPVFLFGFVLLAILGAIRVTTPPIVIAPSLEPATGTHESASATRDSLADPHESSETDAIATHGDARDDS